MAVVMVGNASQRWLVGGSVDYDISGSTKGSGQGMSPDASPSFEDFRGSEFKQFSP